MNPLSAAIGTASARPAQGVARPAPARAGDAVETAGSEAALLALAAMQSAMPLREAIQPGMPGVPGGPSDAGQPGGMRLPDPLSSHGDAASGAAEMATRLPAILRTGLAPPASAAARLAGAEATAVHDRKVVGMPATPRFALSDLGQAAQAPVTAALVALANARPMRAGTATDAGGPGAERAGPVGATSARRAPVPLPGAAAASTEPPARAADTSPQMMPAAHAPDLQVADAQPTGKAVAASPERKLLDALGERINLQARHGVQSAVVRLDPELAGSVVIELRHEAGALHVRISASQAEVAQQLKSIGEGLRHELSANRFGDVTVHIAHDRDGERGGRQQDAQGESRQGQAGPGRALDAGIDGPAFGAEWARLHTLRNTNT